jgi:hypothetical protein
MPIAIKNLGLAHLWVINPGEKKYALDGIITVVPFEELLRLGKPEKLRIKERRR